VPPWAPPTHPRHDRLRGLIQHAFMKRNLLALEEPIRAIAQQVFGQLRGARQFDFKDVLRKFTVRC
jgi:cytochrome P450